MGQTVTLTPHRVVEAHRSVDGYLTDEGLFVTQREGAGWLWDVWVSVEAFATLRDHPAALLGGNLPSLADALKVVEAQR